MTGLLVLFVAVVAASVPLLHTDLRRADRRRRMRELLRAQRGIARAFRRLADAVREAFAPFQAAAVRLADVFGRVRRPVQHEWWTPGAERCRCPACRVSS